MYLTDKKFPDILMQYDFWRKQNTLASWKNQGLTPTTRPRPLEVIVIHTWDVQVSTGDTFDFIVMDTDGDQIHGWIPRRLAPTYEPLLFENNIVRMKNFNVIEKRKKYYSPLRNQYNIVFTGQTKVEQISEQLHFPPQQYRFTEYEDLKPLAGKTDYLADVIGMFEYISPPKQIAATKTIRDVYIRNERYMDNGLPSVSAVSSEPQGRSQACSSTYDNLASIGN